MTHYDWANVPESALPATTGEVLRRFIGGAQMTVARVTFIEGTITPEHRHENEQFTLVIEGALEFTVEGKPVVVRAGECIHLPANELHGARALTHTTVFDVFSPPRADWGPPPPVV